MKPFEYVMVIFSVIIGLTLTQFANVVSFMIKDYDVSKLHFPYICLVILGCITCLNHWGALYPLRNRPSWNMATTGLLFLAGLLLYSACIVATPEDVGFDHNYEALFHRVIAKTLAVMVVFVIVLLIDSVMLKRGRSLSWYLLMVSYIVLMISGVVIQNTIYRDVLVVVMLGLQGVNIALNKFTVSEETMKRI